ncbi:response regulator transcription factor [Gammaproteobacteria bacterium]|nr:response regulator transcription factor [Gammaproteobacteria bacterium]
MAKRILIVEDELDLRSTLEFKFKSEGYSVDAVSKGKEAIEAIARKKPDLVLLDLMLPDMSGLDVCKTIRNSTDSFDISIIMLTAKGEEVDRVLGFELGADDYVVKPFSVRELALRVSTVLKRRDKQEETDNISLGDIEINLSSYRVFISQTEIQLTAKEFLLFKHLVQKNGRIQTREVLLEEVWGYNSFVTTRTVDTHVKRLRSKIGDIGSKIETVRGIGYRFNYVV